MLKKYLFLIFALTGFSVFSNNHADKIVRLSSKQLPYYKSIIWKYSILDSSNFASKVFNDRYWTTCENTHNLHPNFNGKAWFRLTFYCDSTLVNKSLSMGLKHLGASEIYLDGKKLMQYGRVSDSINSIYQNPQEVPLVFNLTDTGKHVIAIKYANYNANRNNKIFKNNFRGFYFIIEDSISGINIKLDNSIATTFISIMLTSIFMMLGLLHLFLFLYDRKAIPNVYLSFFMMSIAALFFIVFLVLNANNPYISIVSAFLTNYLLCFSCIMLSAFINNQFGTKSKTRFLIILFLSIASIVFDTWGQDFYKFISITLFLFVAFESIFFILRAIKRKVKGAKIIGFGFLFIALYFTIVMTAIIVKKDQFDFNDSTTEGLILIILGAMAIISLPFSMTLYIGWNFAHINKNLALQIKQTEALSQKNIEQEQEKVKLISSQNEQLEIKVSERTKELTLEKKKSDDLLLNILPLDIAEELKLKGESNAKLYDNVSVLFTDFVDFTKVGEKLSPESLVEELNFYFTAFDHIIIKHGLEKIKTIGDAYMAVCGIPNEDNQHALKTINAAIEIIEFVKQQKEKKGQFDIRIGINSGPVVAGIIGVKKFAYDIWGDTVNTAARMEQNSEAGKINLSGSTFNLIKENFKCTYRGKINAKNKGDIDMYFLEF